MGQIPPYRGMARKTPSAYANGPILYPKLQRIHFRSTRPKLFRYGAIQMRKFLSLALVIITLAFYGCTPKSVPKPTDLPVKAAPTAFKFQASDQDVEIFLEKNKGFQSGYEKDTCYHITPNDIAENSSFRIFKYASSAASFLLYGDAVYPLGGYFGGYGLTSAALADMNRDKQYELYYTFSWGSGIHRSHIGYFDPATKQATTLGFVYMDEDMTLTTDDQGGLLVCHADVDAASMVDFTVTAGKKLGTIDYQNKTIRVNITDAAQKQ
jgi:hypothetical protein